MKNPANNRIHSTHVHAKLPRFHFKTNNKKRKREQSFPFSLFRMREREREIEFPNITISLAPEAVLLSTAKSLQTDRAMYHRGFHSNVLSPRRGWGGISDAAPPLSRRIQMSAVPWLFKETELPPSSIVPADFLSLPPLPLDMSDAAPSLFRMVQMPVVPWLFMETELPSLSIVPLYYLWDILHHLLCLDSLFIAIVKFHLVHPGPKLACTQKRRRK